VIQSNGYQKIYKITLFSTAIAILVACAANVNKAEYMRPADDPYSEALRKNYLQVAEYEKSYGSQTIANLMADKSIAAAKERQVLPANMKNKSLTKAERRQLQEARERLVLALNTTPRIESPEELANAQAHYDCWAVNAEENKYHADNCRAKYYKKMNSKKLGNHPDVKARLQEKQKIGQLPIETASNMQVSALSIPLNTPINDPKLSQYSRGLPFNIAEYGEHKKVYKIFFDISSVQITEEAQDVLNDIVNELLANNQYRLIRFEGHADLTGGEIANLRVSLERALSASRALVVTAQNGDKPRSMQGYGDKMPIIATKRNVPEVKNRRVEIKLY
jgi:outer membrane protein OmpA-like peptidoglycan-associated protein